MQLPKKNWNLSLDSLSDTMSNGVGILILILVVVTSASILNPLKPGESRLSDPCEQPPDSLNRVKLKDEIARMKEQLTGLEQRSSMAQRQVQTKQSEWERLQKTSKQKELRIPTLQPAPEGLKPLYFVCRNNKICFLDIEQLFDKTIKEIRAAIGQETGQILINDENAAKIEAYFKAHDIGDSYFQLSPTNLGFGVVMKFLPRSRAQGETANQIRRPMSDYAKAIQTVKSDERIVIFLVWNDSFDLYMAAKE